RLANSRRRQAKVCDVSVSSPPSLPIVTDGLGILARFHPAVRTWFQRRFPDGPTAAQTEGWPAILAGGPALTCAPTGPGKPLAGFLAAIDALYRAHEASEAIEGATRVSCLRAPQAL